jgi:hypothetical protein
MKVLVSEGGPTSYLRDYCAAWRVNRIGCIGVCFAEPKSGPLEGKARHHWAGNSRLADERRVQARR